MTPTDDLTQDAFLGAQIRVWQPRSGYRAGVDPVFLAAAVPARAGQSVLELGCGAGVASLCLGRRVDGLDLSGVELHPFYAGLARRNAAENEVALDVVEADLADMPPALRQRQFDHVMANPPYFDRAHSTASPVQAREAAMGEATPLSVWADVAARRLAPGGYASFIHRAERLPELLAAIAPRLGSVQVLPLMPRAGRDAQLVLLRARKGGRAAFRLHAPLLLHGPARHERDGDDYTPEITAVLRHGGALPFPA